MKRIIAYASLGLSIILLTSCGNGNTSNVASQSTDYVDENIIGIEEG